MTIFADASAKIALIVGEDGSDALADSLDADRHPLCSATSVWAVAGLCRSHRSGVPEARAHVQIFLNAAGFTVTAIDARELELATDAYDRFGKGRHPASLNIGDYFAYACAKANHATLLYQGDDFSRTDLA